jgi:membrane protein required for beta-lactamase induction
MVSTISFTCLIFIEFLNLLTELHKVRLVQVCCILVSVIIYLCAILLMRKTLNGIQLFSTAYLPATIIIVVAAWSPPFVFDQVKRWTNPTL